MSLLKIIPAETKIKFMRQKNLAFILSAVLLTFSVFLLSTKGLNFGIDFTGGTVIELRAEQDVELSPLRQKLSQANLGEIALQHIDTNKDVMIRLQKQPGDNEQQQKAVEFVKGEVAHIITGKIDYRKVDFVGPQVGEELITAGIMALALSFLGIMLYIWFRFEWQFGLGAIVALFHDVILTLGLYSFLNLEFNLSSVAAILTIVGYSINDSVVIYDRIRENLRKYKKEAIDNLLDKSINDTLSRTILTAGTTIAALVALVVVGGGVIEGFSIAVLFGVIIGTYSSIYIAAPVLTFFNIRKSDAEKTSTVSA